MFFKTHFWCNKMISHSGFAGVSMIKVFCERNSNSQCRWRPVVHLYKKEIIHMSCHWKGISWRYAISQYQLAVHIHVAISVHISRSRKMTRCSSNGWVCLPYRTMRLTWPVFWSASFLCEVLSLFSLYCCSWRFVLLQVHQTYTFKLYCSGLFRSVPVKLLARVHVGPSLDIESGKEARIWQTQLLPNPSPSRTKLNPVTCCPPCSALPLSSRTILYGLVGLRWSISSGGGVGRLQPPSWQDSSMEIHTLLECVLQPTYGS